MDRALKNSLCIVAPLCAILLLPACDTEEGPMGEGPFVTGTLVGRDGTINFSGTSGLMQDPLGATTCSATNADGYGLGITWGMGDAVVDSPIDLSQTVFIKTLAPGDPGVLVDNFFVGELRFTEIEENFAGTFVGDLKVAGEEKAITEVRSGTFECPNSLSDDSGTG